MRCTTARPDHIRADNVHAITAITQPISNQPGLSAITGISHFCVHAASGGVLFVEESSRHDIVAGILNADHPPPSRRGGGGGGGRVFSGINGQSSFHGRGIGSGRTPPKQKTDHNPNNGYDSFYTDIHFLPLVLD